MLSQPEALVPPLLGMLRQIDGVAKGIRGRAARNDGAEVEDREGNGQFANAGMPVCARPRISAWMSCVPS